MQSITIDYTVLITNDADLQNTDEVMNMAVLTWSDDPTGIGAEASILIEEPILVLDKSAPLTNTGDYARTVTYTMTVQHHASTSAADAFDLVLTDNLSAQGMSYIPGTLQLISGVGYNAGASSLTAGALTLVYDTLMLGQDSVITFDARLDDGQQTPHAVTNTATLTWTSLPEDADPDERSGTGVLPYTTQDMATVDFTSSVFADKRISTSSVDATL